MNAVAGIGSMAIYPVPAWVFSHVRRVMTQ